MTPVKINGQWHAWVYLGRVDGKVVNKHIIANSKTDVMLTASELKKSFDPKTYKNGEITVGEAVDRYIEKRRSTCSPKTIREYLSYRRTAFPDLMATKIRDLTDDFCQAEIDKFASGHAPKSVKSRWTLVVSSVKALNKNFQPEVELPPIKRKRLEMPSPEALQALFDDVSGKPIELPIYLACMCGLRRGEISALRISDFDFEKKLVRINKDMVMDEHAQWIIKPPKTDAANRSVPVPDWLLQIVQKKPSSYTFMRPTSITDAFGKLAQKHGLSCSFHGLRHYYASVMESLGIPESYQMERLGHTTNSMLKRYHEYLKEKEAEVNDALMDHLNALNPKKKAATTE